MNLSYSKFFSLKVLHRYFRDNICRDILLFPSPATEVWMDRYDLLLREQDNEFHLLAGDELRESFIRDFMVKYDAVLSFLLYSLDPYFKNYTAFAGQDMLNSIYLFREVEGATQLNGSEMAASSFFPKQLGKYRRGLIPAGCIQIRPAAGVYGKSYTVQFDSRQLWWKYIISNRQGLTLNDAAIIDSISRNKNSFSNPVATQLPGGGNAFVFVSNNEMPLSEKAPVIFQLVKNHKEAAFQSEPVINFLKNASPESIRYDAVEKKWYAEIYDHI